MYKTGILLGIVSTIFILSTSFFQKYDLAKSVARGKEAYASFCMNCHMEDGKGTDIFPPVAKTDYLKKPGNYLINIILLGQSDEITVNNKKYNAIMPAQAYLTDEQIADALNYIRNSLGNKITTPITPNQVKALRQ